MNNKKYIIACGGTSGHIHPAIAIADEIRKNEPDSIIIFCGTKNGIENTVIPNHGYNIVHIDALGFPKKFSIKLFKAIIAFFLGRKQSKKLLLNEKPDVVIGTGGYVCGPVVSMASSLKIPTLIHEQNAFPGKANKFLSKRADVVCVSFPNTDKVFSKAKKTVLSGNPVREIFYNISKESARKELGIGVDEKIVFATGGSLGARTINNAVLDVTKNHEKLDYRFILACGKTAYPDMLYKAKEFANTIDLKEYLLDQHLYLASADIVLCRAGALTCSEIAILGKASIMVPYPYAAGDHQTFNARSFSDIGGSVLIKDSEMNSEKLYNELENLFNNPSKIREMEIISKTLAMPKATAVIYNEIIQLVL